MYEHFGFELVTKVLIVREFLQMIVSKHALTPDLARSSAGTVSTTLRLGKASTPNAPLLAFVSLTF